jgi:hypothetical protein
VPVSSCHLADLKHGVGHWLTLKPGLHLVLGTGVIGEPGVSKDPYLVKSPTNVCNPCVLERWAPYKYLRCVRCEGANQEDAGEVPLTQQQDEW